MRNAQSIELNITRSAKINFQSRGRSFGDKPNLFDFFPPRTNRYRFAYRSSKNFHDEHATYFLFFLFVRLAVTKETSHHRDDYRYIAGKPTSTNDRVSIAQRICLFPKQVLYAYNHSLSSLQAIR